MKKIYFIRAAKAEGFSSGISDYERSLKPKGVKEVKTMGSYLALHNISINVVLSSCAMRAQETLTLLESVLRLSAKKQFLEELYYRPYEEVLKIIMAQDDEDSTLLVIGHYPQLNELINVLSSEAIKQFPKMGVVALSFEVKSWSDLGSKNAEIDFFIYPKQFKYYMPRNTRSKLGL